VSKYPSVLNETVVRYVYAFATMLQPSLLRYVALDETHEPSEFSVHAPSALTDVSEKLPAEYVASEGAAVGANDGANVGTSVGASVAPVTVGPAVGANVGDTVTSMIPQISHPG
jgi:hypothetical protein